MQAPNTVTFSYDTREDRIMAVVNVGRPEAWSCWLTRRLLLILLERAPELFASTSTLARGAPADVRGELVAFERDAAIAKTAKAMTPTPKDVIKKSMATAELASKLTISGQGDNVRFELYGENSGKATVALTRAELQRVFQMLGAEAAKAGWLPAPAKSPGTAVQEKPASKPVSH